MRKRILILLSALVSISTILMSCTTSELGGMPSTSTVTVAVKNTPIAVSGTVSATIPTTSVVSINQSVLADANNSSSANLNAGATFTGTRTSTLGVVGIQVSIKTDQNCTVYIDQAPDITNWDITDTFNYIASKGGNGWTIQAVNSYVRVRVTNVGTAVTTYFRLQTCLCPIVEAVPRSLNSSGRFVTDTTLSDAYGFTTEMTPMGELRTITPYRLVGAIFIGNTVDTNFWTTSTANGGTVTQTGGQLTLRTNTPTANGTAAITSVRRARYVSGSSMRYRALAQNDSGVANNKRIWGVADWTTMPTFTDGAYFYLDGTTFGVATLKSSAETAVPNGSFNGDYGSSFTLGTSLYTFEIYWTNSKVYFVINGKVLHIVTATSATWTNTVTLYLVASNINSGGGTSDKSMNIRVQSIYRLGDIQTAPIYKHITSGTTVCKLGAGNLHSIIVNTPANNTITVYDNTAGSGTIIAVIALGNNTFPFALAYNLDFYTGLTVVCGAAMDITVVLE